MAKSSWIFAATFVVAGSAFGEGIEGSKLIDTVALIQLAFSFATFALFAAKTSESSRVV